MINLEGAIDRWTEQILPSKEEFLKALKERQLRIYHGIDPTGPQLHLGHSTNLLLLRAFQDAGHKITFLIGDFTGMIGDPTGKISSRKQLSKEEVMENAKTYKEQVSKILNFDGDNPAEIKYNSEWFSKMNAGDWIKLSSLVTSQQIIERDMFQERQKKGQDIFMHEFFYPLIQGYDSVALNVDAEVGGTDQLFNMMVGRRLLKKLKDKEKFVITTPLLINPKTNQKLMNKSEGVYIALDDNSDKMYGGTMSLPDEAVVSCLQFCTTVDNLEIQSIKEGLQANKVHPMNAKKRLAWEIVKMYHGEKEADKAKEEFEQVFQERGVPADIPTYKITEDTINLIDILVERGLIKSKSEAKRLIEQGGVKWNGEKVTGPILKTKNSGVLKVGKYRFIKLEK